MNGCSIRSVVAGSYRNYGTSAFGSRLIRRNSGISVMAIEVRYVSMSA